MAVAAEAVTGLEIAHLVVEHLVEVEMAELITVMLHLEQMD
jgi:hypothetical protein